MTPLATIQGLTKHFGFHTALDGVDLTLEAGRIIGIMGPNGAGKTTLLKILAGVLPPGDGRVQICGQTISPATRALTSYAPDHNHFFQWMRVEDALAYYADMFADFDLPRARELCQYLQLDPKAHVRQLSFGDQERATILLTLARRARLYLLDEPFTGIDPLAKEKVLKSILTALTEESSVVISTHQVKEIETTVDDVVFLDHGKVRLAQSAEDIRAGRGLSVEECYIQEYSND